MHIPRGSKKYPSGFEEIQGRVDRAIGRAIERALKRRRDAPEPFRPKGRTPSGGWSWETYRRDVERVIKDSARRRGAPDPTRRRDTPVRTKREPIRHPFPPPVLGPQEAEQIEREVFEGIPEPVMPPLPRTAESRGFGDIKHSFPRPAPEPLPPMEPKIELPPVEVAAPPPRSRLLGPYRRPFRCRTRSESRLRAFWPPRACLLSRRPDHKHGRGRVHGRGRKRRHRPRRARRR